MQHDDVEIEVANLFGWHLQRPEDWLLPAIVTMALVYFICHRIGESPIGRVLKGIREDLLQHLHGYKGPDVHSRGLDPESEAFYTLDDLEKNHELGDREGEVLLLRSYTAMEGDVKGGYALIHKAGWISYARHDAGLVYWPGGVFVAAVMTTGSGVGVASDLLAARVARVTLQRVRRLG